MVVQKTLDNLKERPHDEKKAVASGVAIVVVIVLLVGWGFLFLRKIQRGSIPTLETSTVPGDQFDEQFLQQTQQQINQLYNDPSAQLRDIRNASAQGEVQQDFQSESVSPYENVDGFGAQESQF